MKSGKLLLSGRRCFITSSSNGLGWNVAKSLANYGANVILHADQRFDKELQQAFNHLPKNSPTQTHNYVMANLLNRESMLSLPSQLKKISPSLDVFIHNAIHPAVTQNPSDVTKVEDYPFEMFEGIIKINLNVPFALTQLVLPLLRNGERPSIIYASSGLGKQRQGKGSNYVSKFEVRCSDMLASMLSHELKNFRINSIHPVPKEPGKDEEPFENLTPFVWLTREDTKLTGRHINCQDWVGRDPGKFIEYEDS